VQKTTQGNGLILVAEDEAILRMVAVSFFEDAGFATLEAANADEAIGLLESRGDISLVFTDIDMPPGSMNGLKLARAIYERWPPIKIILVSGHHVPDSELMPKGSRFFAKPYAHTAMIETVRQMLAAA
jgi:CheY-like chemotaxis protein